MPFYYDIVNWLYSDINKKKSDTKGHMLYRSHLYEMSRKGKFKEIKGRLVLVSSWSSGRGGIGEWQLICVQFLFAGNVDALKLNDDCKIKKKRNYMFLCFPTSKTWYISTGNLWVIYACTLLAWFLVLRRISGKHLWTLIELIFFEVHSIFKSGSRAPQVILT